MDNPGADSGVKDFESDLLLLLLELTRNTGRIATSLDSIKRDIEIKGSYQRSMADSLMTVATHVKKWNLGWAIQRLETTAVSVWNAWLEAKEKGK